MKNKFLNMKGWFDSESKNLHHKTNRTKGIMEELLTITLEDKTTLEHIYKRRGKGNKEKDI